MTALLKLRCTRLIVVYNLFLKCLYLVFVFNQVHSSYLVFVLDTVNKRYILRGDMIPFTGCNIGSKYVTCRVGQAVPKVYLPCQLFHLPRNCAIQRRIILQALCPKHYFPSGASHGLVLLARLLFFCRRHLQLAKGQAVMLHA